MYVPAFENGEHKSKIALRCLRLLMLLTKLSFTLNFNTFNYKTDLFITV